MASNPNRQAARARSWQRGQARKQERSSLQEQRHKYNLDLLRTGELTPWMTACADRAARRLAGGLTSAAYEASQKKEPLPAA
jgi:hypothetical protein